MILLSIVFVSFALSIIAAIEICRELVLNSASESYGRLWTKSILGEYDTHLIEDYGLLAYHGLDSDVIKKIGNYSNYTLKNKMNVKKVAIDSNLMGHELSNPENFRKAVKNSGISNAIDSIVGGKNRKLVESTDDDRWGNRKIRNRAVIAALPSENIKNLFDVDSIKDTIKSLKNINEVIGKASDTGYDIAFIYKYLGSHTSTASENKTLFRNEWEYVAFGNLDDEENFKDAKNKIKLIRNALNLAYLYSDTGKRELINTAAQLITPGPAAAATGVLIAEAWAFAEAELDMKVLLENKRVPIMKDDDSWKTDLGGILKKDEIVEKLDDEAKELLDKNYDEINKDKSGHGGNGTLKDGLSYEDYLMTMITAMNSNIRTLRIMDLVVINMKYRYYEDFNMDEYHVGVSYSLKPGIRQHEFEEEYK